MMGIDKLKNGHWPVFLISLVSAITNLFLPVILVRILTPEDIGVYKIFFLYAQSITFLSLAGGPLYSVYYWVGKKENHAHYLEQAWILSFILSLVSALIGLIFTGKISHLIAITEKQTILLLLSAITAAPAAFYGEYLIAKGRRINGALFNSGFEILKGLIIIALVYFTKNINSAFWGYTILFIFKFALAASFGRREKILNYKIDIDKIKEVWRYCAPLSIAGALGFFLEKVDMILLSSQLNTVHFAYYSMGCLLVPPLLLLEMSVQKVLIPALSTSFHKENLNEMVMHYRKAQADIAYLMIPAVFGLIIFNRPIIEILFTSQYMESASFLKLYAFTYLAYIIPHDAVARATGNTKWVFKMYLILTPLSIVVVYFFAGLYGAKGALVSSMAFMFIPKIPGLMYSSFITKVRISKLIAWRAMTSFVGINIILMMMSYAAKPLFSTEKKWFFVIAPIYALLYLASINIIKHYKIKYEEKV